MRIIVLTIIVGLLVSTACLEPDRAPYDPNNPNKPSLYGYTYHYDGSPLPGATIKLRQFGEVKYSTVSNTEAWFEFVDIDPGVYELYGEAEYYDTQIETTYLCAGCRDTIDIYFQELYFHFDNEALGTQEPFGFNQLYGTWEVQEDLGEPDDHSTPNVYNALHDGTGPPFALSVFRDTLEDFWIGVNIKVRSLSVSWHAGLMLRYQNESNYYLVRFMPDTISLMKMRNGNLIELESDTYNFAPDTWYRVSAYLHDDYIKIYVDYEEVFERGDYSSPLSWGSAGLWLYTSEPTGSATANFDDVHIRP
ncbi:hypothetical protein AMJ87_00220 [candidate division WOR_3 bacterium SM23_60]|uniref:3-keto-disaccharide hydrolase domain-containing protein n=1 Tax=candidate division WOR_3 bacterium SM23_60 TaxID=1703780 RepID=A0A0S8GN78_UNCW3|nr:MAG: hypothetical protein AMJ87_00220 [candidate division WOR_3 bacterium SM23_60]